MKQNQSVPAREDSATGLARRYLVVDRTLPLRSESLFTQNNEVLIKHQGEHYRLRRTRNGKLILTK
ncbi:MAG: hemin uptake protein HemP [Sulfuriferula sp.]